jgi:hypothetical protein
MNLGEVITKEIFWTAIGSIATAIGATATVLGAIGVFFAARQLRFQAWLKAQEIWTAGPFVEARESVFSQFDTIPEQVIPDDRDDRHALLVCRRMDEFAGLIPYLSKKKALEIWGVPFAKAWLLLASIVYRERDKDSWKGKWRAFEDLGKAALETYPWVATNHNTKKSG